MNPGNLIIHNTGTYPLVFFMEDPAAVGIGITGLSPTVSVSKNGGAFAAADGTILEIGLGWYKVAPGSESDTLGPVILEAFATPVAITYRGRSVYQCAEVDIGQLADGAITAAKLADAAITAAKIADAAITAAKIADAAITAAKIADAAITAAKIDTDAINSTKIADDAINANKLADGTITAAKLAADSITSTKLADGAITAAKFADGAITATKLAAGAITAAAVAAGAVSPVTLSAGTVDSTAVNANFFDVFLDSVNGVEPGWSLRQALRIILSSVAGKLAGAGTAVITIRDVNDTLDRIVADVTGLGNRTNVTHNP